MACPEITMMRQQVCAQLSNTVNTWQENLQAKWGDPRVYEAQQAERARIDTALAHDLSRRNELLLQDAYAKQAEKNRASHSERIKHHVGQSASTPPQSGAKKPRSRKS